MRQETKEAIDNLYKAFGNCPKPAQIDGCPCCIKEKKCSVLLSKPLKKLTPDELSSYAASLFLTVGDVTDFQYYLPRVFEISATDDSWWPDPEVVLGKLRYANWDTWSHKKRDAVLEFIDAVLYERICDPDGNIDSWVCAIAHCVTDLSPYLDRIKHNAQSMIRYYEHNSGALIKGKLSNSFWDDAPEGSRQVVQWFNSEDIKNIIAKEYNTMYKK